MRAAIALAVLALVGCASEEVALDDGLAYLDDDGYRRAALEASFVRDDNGYAALRLAHYGRGDEGWDALPLWNPPVRPVTVDDVGRFRGDPARVTDAPMAPVLESVEPTEEALRELGRRAFETYPVQISDSFGSGAEDLESVERYGLSVDDRGRVGGLVRVRTPSGGERFAVTCATCHARAVDGELVHGMASRADWGALAHRAGLRAGQDPERLAPYLAWGPGRVDVTSDGVNNPVAMSDLRPLARQPYLHWAANVRNDLVALAIRIETLLITSGGQNVRPPREIALGLALYLRSLADDRAPEDRAAHPEGAALYDRPCGSCHGDEGRPDSGRVPLDEVGTDPAVGLSSMRGTGHYRVPSLWAVADRSPLLHDASVPDLQTLLDPARLDEAPGHVWGTGLSPTERAALTRYVQSMGTVRTSESSGTDRP